MQKTIMDYCIHHDVVPNSPNLNHNPNHNPNHVRPTTPLKCVPMSYVNEMIRYRVPVTINQSNPKVGMSRVRYELYKGCKTASEIVELASDTALAKRDLQHDLRCRHISPSDGAYYTRLQSILGMLENNRRKRKAGATPTPTPTWCGKKQHRVVETQPPLRRQAPRRTIPRYVSNVIAFRQRHACAACGEHLCHWHVDHVRPVADGGSDDITNLQALCPNCHDNKTRVEHSSRMARKHTSWPIAKHPPCSGRLPAGQYVAN